MKIIIAGSRGIEDLKVVEAAMAVTGLVPTEVVSGGAQGVDELGERWALARLIPITVFRADWHKHGIAAGPIRNAIMATYADQAVICWDGQSRGSRDMANQMKRLGKSYYLFIIPKEPNENLPNH